MREKREKSEFEIARKKRQNKIAAQRLKNLLIFGFIFVVIVTAIYFVISEDVIGIIGDRIASSSSQGGVMPVELGGNNVKGMFECGENFGMVSDASVFLYTQEGKKLLSFSHDMVNPISKSNGRKFLVFDQGGTKVILRTRDKVLFEKTFDYTIINASLSENGWVCVITNAQRYASELHVWDNRYENEIFTWSASDDYIIDACINEEDKTVATVSLSGDSYGDIVSTVKLFSTKTGKVISSKSFSNSSALDIEFDSKGNIKLICDNMAVMLDKKCEIVNRSEYDDKIISFVNEPKSNYALIIFDRYTESRTTGLRFLGNDFIVAKDTAVNGKYAYSDGNANNVVLYTGVYSYVYDTNGTLVNKYRSDLEINKVLLVGENVFVSTNDIIDQLRNE